MWSLIAVVDCNLGHIWAHHCCAAWSEGVIQSEDFSLHFVDKAVFAGLAQVGISFSMAFYLIVYIISQSLYIYVCITVFSLDDALLSLL